MQTVKQSVQEWLTSVEAALSYLGEEDNEVIRYRKLISVFDDSKDHLVNYQTVVVLVRAINEKREPNWDDPNEWKYYNWFWMGGSSGFPFCGFVSWNSYSGVGSRLCFFNPGDGEYLAKQFPDVFKNFMLIIK